MRKDRLSLKFISEGQVNQQRAVAALLKLVPSLQNMQPDPQEHSPPPPASESAANRRFIKPVTNSL
jgi:hypothetical protein